MDAVQRQSVGRSGAHREAVAWPEPETLTGDLSQYVHRPGQSALRQKLISQLTEHCRRRLPEHMVPSTFVLVESLPVIESAVAV